MIEVLRCSSASTCLPLAARCTRCTSPKPKQRCPGRANMRLVVVDMLCKIHLDLGTSGPHDMAWRDWPRIVPCLTTFQVSLSFSSRSSLVFVLARICLTAYRMWHWGELLALENVDSAFADRDASERGGRRAGLKIRRPTQRRMSSWTGPGSLNA